MGVYDYRTIDSFQEYVLACSESEQEMAIKEVGYSEEHALVWHNAVPDSSLERGKWLIYLSLMLAISGDHATRRILCFCLMSSRR